MIKSTEEENIGVMDAHFLTDGKGLPFLHIKAGGSVCAPSHFTVDHRLHYLYQEGRTVFRYAVTSMSDDCALKSSHQILFSFATLQFHNYLLLSFGNLVFILT